MSIPDGPTVVVKLNRIPQLSAKFEEAVKAVLGKGAFDCEAQIKGLIQAKGIIDTGAYLNSWQTSESGGVGRIEFTNSSDIFYGPFQEYGTVKMAARPHVHPAFDAVSPGVLTAMKLIGNSL